MSVFEYLGVFLSLIMGLGVTHILTGISKTVHFRQTVKPCWVQLMWALNSLIYIIIIWWGMFWWSGQEHWSFFQFLFIILYAIALFALCSLLYPWSIAPDFDFEAHFYNSRMWFFGALTVCWLIDIPETLMKSGEGLRALPAGYLIFIGVHLALSVSAMLTDSRRYHAIYAVAWPLYTLAYLSLSTLREIAT